MQPNYSMLFTNFRILNLSFSINPFYKKKKTIPIDSKIGLAHKYNDRKKSLTIFLKISLVGGDTPFFFEVEGEGEFVFKNKPEDNILKNVSMINGPAIMFPYIRETIADLTRRAGFPPLHLPPVNFIQLAEGKKNKVLLSDKMPLKE